MKKVKNAPPKTKAKGRQGAQNNSLSEAIMGFNPNSIGVQLSQADTMFKNLRWYMISNFRQLLSEMYVEHGLIQTIVDVPVDDGLRGGVQIKSDQLDENEIKQLKISMEKEDDFGTIGQAMKWTRLFGGGGVVIVTDQDPSTPLNMDAIDENSPLEFKAVDLWELYWDQQNTQGFNPTGQEYDYEYYRYYGVKLHKSRVMKMKGITAPSFVRPRLRGWGFSVVESLVRSLNQYLKANDLTFEILDEFKIDVYKIKGLSSTLLSANGTQKIKDRMQLANFQKNYQNAVTMDAEDDFIQKELAFTGISETLIGIRMHIASDLRMPLTKIFGISAAGFSSGEDDIENYNAMVESQVRSKCKFYILELIQLRCKKLFGYVPDDLEIEFEPLRVLSAEQEENVKTQVFNRCLAAKQAGEMDSQDFREACNKANLLPINLDKDKTILQPNQTGDGANKPDDQKAEVAAPAASASVTTAPVAKNTIDNSGSKKIGTTRSGKPIYSTPTNPAHDRFTEQDHADAQATHDHHYKKSKGTNKHLDYARDHSYKAMSFSGKGVAAPIDIVEHKAKKATFEEDQARSEAKEARGRAQSYRSILGKKY